MRFRVLGPLEAVGASGQPLVVSGSKERSLLAALLVSPGEVVSTDRLIDILWPDASPANPSNALQARVSALRKSLGDPGLVVARSPGYRLDVDRDDVDSARFERLVGEGRRKAGTEAVGIYEEALALWRGTPFADFVYQDFARPEIARLEALWMTAQEERLDLILETGRSSEVIAELEALVVEHPLRERFWGQLMVALYRSGRQADALRAYREAARTLGEELGIEPSAELRAVEEAILTQDPGLSGPPSGPSLPVTNLPARMTSLVGRSEDVPRVTALLAEQRLVTLTGPGGVGKTSLALACGRDAVALFPHGVWLVELAGVNDPSLVPVELARSLGVEVGNRPTLDLVCDVVRNREMLIIMDNCEHLVEAVATTAASVLQRAAAVKVLATSREPLGVPGEILWPTRPLAVPENHEDITSFDRIDSVRLFVERARAVSPDFEITADNSAAIGDICRRLDGLPLAIELAAARVRTLGPVEIAARLDDRFRLLTGTARTVLPRQQTLDAAIDWSHGLLSADERELFRRLSVFSGGWSLDSAGAVASDPERVLDLMTRLVDRSLVNPDDTRSGPRYTMLETIRAFARRELAASGDERDSSLRHAHWFRDLAESARLQGRDQAEWAAVLSRDHENLRAAIDHALRHDDEETALRLGAALGWWWFFGNRDEGRAILDRLLAATVGRIDAQRVGALLARALLDLFGPTPQTLAVAEEALAAATSLGDVAGAATAKLFLALDGVFGRDTAASERFLEQALAVYEETGDAWGQGLTRFLQMELAGHRGDLVEAIARGEEALDLFERTGDPWAISAALAHLGRYGRLTGQTQWASQTTLRALGLAQSRGLPHTVQYVVTDRAHLLLQEGDARGALALFDEAMTIAEAVGNQVGVASICNGLGEARLALGEADEARRLHEKARSLFDELGLATGVSHSQARLGLASEVAGDWDEGVSWHTAALETARSSGDVVNLLLATEGLGRTKAALGLWDDAAHLLAAGAALRSTTSLMPSRLEADATEKAAKAVNSEVGGAVTVTFREQPVNSLTLPPESG